MKGNLSHWFFKRFLTQLTRFRGYDKAGAKNRIVVVGTASSACSVHTSIHRFQKPHAPSRLEFDSACCKLSTSFYIFDSDKKLAGVEGFALVMASFQLR